MTISTTGYGELAVMKKLNDGWGDGGYCMRLQQHIGPTVLSDLIFASKGIPCTVSIEVKKVTEKLSNAGTNWEAVVPRHLKFMTDFSITTIEHERYKHQLERQVMLCRQMGWRACILLYVLHPKGHGKPTRYLLDSEKVYAFWKAGNKYLPSSMFDDFHDSELANLLFLGDSKWIRTTKLTD